MNALKSLCRRYDDDPLKLRRSKRGESLSLFRYHNAEGFFRSIERRYPFGPRDLLYHAGIVVQLGISSHLLQMGFPDKWCVRNISLHVAKSLAYANATGFAHDCPDMARLATVLDPYWKWGHAHDYDKPAPDDGGFDADDVRRLLRALLDQVHAVTGHPRPSGWVPDPPPVDMSDDAPSVEERS